MAHSHSSSPPSLNRSALLCSPRRRRSCCAAAGDPHALLLFAPVRYPVGIVALSPSPFCISWSGSPLGPCRTITVSFLPPENPRPPTTVPVTPAGGCPTLGASLDDRTPAATAARRNPWPFGNLQLQPHSV